ncbi:MAG: class I SAM-dependent methyltransferase [archaeon]
MKRGISKRRQRKLVLARAGFSRPVAATPEQRKISAVKSKLNSFEKMFDRYCNPLPWLGGTIEERVRDMFGTKSGREFGNAMLSGDPKSFEKIAPVYRRMVEKHEEILKMSFALRGAEFRQNDKVLSIGCGFGLHEVFLAKNIVPQGSVVGIDLSGRMVKQAKRIAEIEGAKNARFVQKSAYNTGLRAQSFDKVVCNWAMDMPAFDRRGTASEIGRVLKRNYEARAIITIPQGLIEERKEEIAGEMLKNGFRISGFFSDKGYAEGIVFSWANLRGIK